jgi:hypothetical protein
MENQDIESLAERAVELGWKVERADDGHFRFIPPGGRLKRAGRPGPVVWEDLGLGHDDLPTHLPMGVNEQGQGPEDDSVAHHYECWCSDPKCPLTAALQLAWEAGRRQSP